jgi:3-hydroxy-9,10-secoandrosta-1,3,5(10)-triene-9,17-dione monooxygenase reductase component
MSEIFGRLGGARDDEPPAEEQLVPDYAGTRWLRRQLAAGVVALTTVVDGAYRAATLSASLVASLEPALVLVSLDRDSQIQTWVEESGVMGLSFLTRRQQVLADRFAGFTPLASPRFEGIEHFTAVTGSPLLSSSVAWADCRVESQFDAGDHVCVVARIEALGKGEGHADQALVYYQSRYWSVG